MATIFYCNNSGLPARLNAVRAGKGLLKEDKYKQIIIDALKFLVVENKISLNGFVIMENHVHFIWQAKGSLVLQEIQNSFIKHTAKQFKKLLIEDNKLDYYAVHKIDRKYNFWQRDSMNVELFTPAVFYQKLSYIHYNPVRAGLCSLPDDYLYSSALFYAKGIDDFKIIEHYMG